MAVIALFGLQFRPEFARAGLDATSAAARDTRAFDGNQLLFRGLASDHLAEMLPIIYAPTAGTAFERYAHEFRHGGTVRRHVRAGQGLVAAMMRREGVPEISLFLDHAAAFVHRMASDAMVNDAGDSNYLRLQLTRS